jgi:hypothetical protein
MAEAAFRKPPTTSDKEAFNKSLETALDTAGDTIREGYMKQLSEKDQAIWSNTIDEAVRNVRSEAVRHIRLYQNDPLCPVHFEPISEQALNAIKESLPNMRYPAFDEPDKRKLMVLKDEHYFRGVGYFVRESTEALLAMLFIEEMRPRFREMFRNKNSNQALGAPTWTASWDSIVVLPDGHPSWPVKFRVKPHGGELLPISKPGD